MGLADVQTINVSRLVGEGIMHTKLWVVDQKHFYVGSANMDWRSLTQVNDSCIILLTIDEEVMAESMVTVVANKLVSSLPWPLSAFSDSIIGENI